MRTGTVVFLSALGAAGAGLAVYLLREKPEALRFLTAGIVFTAPWAIHAAVSKPDCSFLYITDTHGPVVPGLVDRMLREEGISLVAHGGDVSDEPRFWRPWWDEPFAAVETRWPVYAAEGNHDADSDTNRQEFRARFGDLPTSTRCGNAELFFLPWAFTRSDAEWLWTAVRASTAPVKVLVTHKPVWPARDDDARRRDLILPVIDQFQLVLAGHEHIYQDSMHGTTRQVIEISGSKKYDCPAGARNCVENSTGYLRVDIHGNTVKVTRRTV